MTEDWVTRLSDSRDRLSKREQDLLDAIAARPHEASFLKLADLCTFAGVSKPIVISCYRALGYETYQTFIDGVREFYAGQIDSARASTLALKAVTSVSDLVTQALAVEHAALDTLEKHLEAARVEALARAILQAQVVYLYSEGTGFLPAQYLAQRLRRAGIRSILIGGDRIHALDDLGPLGPKDVFLSFAYTQDKEWLSRLFSEVKRRGGINAVVTGTPDPTLYDLCQHQIFVPRGQWDFKNSMAVPVAFSHILLLTVEYLGGEGIQTILQKLETTRKGLRSETSEEES